MSSAINIFLIQKCFRVRINNNIPYVDKVSRSITQWKEMGSRVAVVQCEKDDREKLSNE